MEDLFQIFLREWSLRSIQQAFYQLCVNRGADPTDYTNIYDKLKQADRFLEASSKQRTLWALLDKRRAHKEYQGQQACRGMNVLVVGGGPCGLRAAIECALLGAQVVVAEGRDRFTRNNVLHLWQFVIHDLKALGAKVFMPKFCTGSIEHISIRKLQFILLKVALLLGVQFHDAVFFEDLVEPRDGRGWRARFQPRDHLLADYEFDVVIGASGKHMCLPAFQQVVVRGKLAIGITANFVNKRTKMEDAVPEIQGVAYIYRQHFFDQLQASTGVKLENIVYYKGDTHYFVMCGDKQNLVQKGVIKKDDDDIKRMLAKDNIDNEMLCKYVMQVVDHVTEGGLSGVQFALNARRQPDVALFDFTELSSADHSTRFVKYMDHPLVLTVVGDLLHEPFWPTGSGCARGFLGVLDTAWLLRGICRSKEPISKLLAEREGVYKLLGQTQPNNLSTAYHKYSIDPRERYACFQQTQADVRHLMGTGDLDEPQLDHLILTLHRSPQPDFQRRAALFRFCYMAAQSHRVRISGFRAASWADGRALAALVAKFNAQFAQQLHADDPDQPDAVDLNLVNHPQLCMDALNFAEQHLQVPKPCRTQAEWANLSEKRRADYLQVLVDALRSDPFHAKLCLSPTLHQSYAADRATQNARQAKVLRARQLPPADPRQAVLNADPLAACKSAADPNPETTLKPRLSNSSPVRPKRPSVEPLNPELLFKVDRIVTGSAPTSPRTVKTSRPSMGGGPNLKERSKVFTDEQKTHVPKSVNLDDSIQSGSLAGVQSVRRFRARFDAVPESPKTPQPTPRRLQQQLPSAQLDRTNSNSPSDSSASSASAEKTEEIEKEKIGKEGNLVHEMRRTSEENGGMQLEQRVRVTVRETVAEFPAAPRTNRSGSDAVMYRADAQPSTRPVSLPVGRSVSFHHQRQQQQPQLPTPPSPLSHSAQHSLHTLHTTVTQRRMRLCQICGGEVYLAEQLLVDRLSLHKQCFRCAFCDRALTVRSAALDRSLQKDYGPRWYCPQHQTLSANEKLHRLRRTAQKLASTAQSVAVVAPNTSRDPSPTNQPHYPTRTFLSSTDSTDSDDHSDHLAEDQTRNVAEEATQTTPHSSYLNMRIRCTSPMQASRRRQATIDAMATTRTNARNDGPMKPSQSQRASALDRYARTDNADHKSKYSDSTNTYSKLHSEPIENRYVSTNTAYSRLDKPQLTDKPDDRCNGIIRAQSVNYKPNVDVGVTYRRRFRQASDGTDDTRMNAEQRKSVVDFANSAENDFNRMHQSEPHRQVDVLQRQDRYQRRLSDFDSPTQLIAACKERTAHRLAQLRQRRPDENQRNKSGSSSSEEDWRLNDGFGRQSTLKASDDDVDEEDEFLFDEDTADDYQSANEPRVHQPHRLDAPIDEEAEEEEESWLELREYLDRVLVDEPHIRNEPTSPQARQLVDDFNRFTLLAHFGESAKAQQKPPETPFFTPRQTRAETVNTAQSAFSPNETALFQTPPTSLRTGQERREEEEIDGLKARINQNATAFPTQPPAASAATSATTPTRPNRFRRGPRRATVAVDLKRESALDVQLKSADATTPIEPTKAADLEQHKQRVLHIRPTPRNLQRVRHEIECIRERRQREKERQLQGVQRRMHEVEVRLQDVRSVGTYLERSLRKDPSNKWELEQWLIYAQQYEALRVEERDLHLKLRAAQLEEEYQQLKRRLTALQREHATDDARFIRNDQLEKELMSRLLDVLNRRDGAQAELDQLNAENGRVRRPATELMGRAPSYDLYEPVFLDRDPQQAGDLIKLVQVL